MNWKLSSILVLALSGCNGTAPVWDAKIYAGYSKEGGFRRTQSLPPDPAFFKCTEPKTDEGAWISYADIGKLPDLFAQCREWKPGTNLEKVSEQVKRIMPGAEKP